jgi:hypothetical protein
LVDPDTAIKSIGARQRSAPHLRLAPDGCDRQIAAEQLLRPHPAIAAPHRDVLAHDTSSDLRPLARMFARSIGSIGSQREKAI